MASDYAEPIVNTKHPEKRMGKAVKREVSGFCFVDKRESSIANCAKFAELDLFFAKEGSIDGNRRAETLYAVINEEKRKAKAF